MKGTMSMLPASTSGALLICVTLAMTLIGGATLLGTALCSLCFFTQRRSEEMRTPCDGLQGCVKSIF